MNTNAHQLLLVKDLYLRGNDALQAKRPFSAGVAVSFFQDAVELLLWATSIHVEAKPSEKFDGMWDSIKSGTKYPVGKELPLRSAMASLNKARVNFKHYGVSPDATEAVKFGAYTEEFLTVVFCDFFGLDFEQFSAVDLIQDTKVASHLKAAEQALTTGDIKGAIEEAATAHAYAEIRLSRVLPSLDFDFGLFVARTVKPDDPRAAAILRSERVETVLEAQRDFLITTSLGIRLADFLRFSHITPYVFFESDSTRTEWGTESESAAATTKDAGFAVRYATDFALALERSLSGVPANTYL